MIQIDNFMYDERTFRKSLYVVALVLRWFWWRMREQASSFAELACFFIVILLTTTVGRSIIHAPLHVAKLVITTQRNIPVLRSGELAYHCRLYVLMSSCNLPKRHL